MRSSTFLTLSSSRVFAYPDLSARFLSISAADLYFWEENRSMSLTNSVSLSFTTGGRLSVRKVALIASKSDVDFLFASCSIFERIVLLIPRDGQLIIRLRLTL